MISTSVTIKLKEDIDVEPMALLVNKASSYDCNIYIKLDNKTINAKSIMGVMSLIIDDGDEVEIITDGTDEEEAAMGIKSFLRSM